MAERPTLVPVDGSTLAERAIPYALALARATGSRVLLLGVRQGLGPEFEGDRELGEELRESEENGYRQYLATLAKKIGAEGVEVETELHVDNPADGILRAIEEHDPQLLVMATHGRSGFSRWRYGSVASRLMREAPVPTLVVGPAVLEHERSPAIQRILVPLDGSPLAEAALQAAGQLADAFGAEILLARAIRWESPAYMYEVPAATVDRVSEKLMEAAEEYLARLQDRLRPRYRTKTSVLQGMAADALLDLAERENIDLVVMASHTRTGIARAVLGSVADRMLQGKAPVLLIRPEGAAAVVRAARGRYCHACGRASPYVQVVPEDRCLRCGQYLHVCANCVYHDGIGCLLQRSEAHDVYPGLNCPYFQFRETDAPMPSRVRTKQ